MLIINLQWDQLQAGRLNPIFTTDNNIEYIENKWVIQLHTELKTMTGKLWCSHIPNRTLLRANDQFLMDAWDAAGLQSSTLQTLNYCRMYLRVARLSDIVTNDGCQIQAQYLYGTAINPHTTHEWPRQEKPGPHA